MNFSALVPIILILSSPTTLFNAQSHPNDFYSIYSPNSQIAQKANLIIGTVSYREKIALPANSVITVQLLEVSRQDTPATIISQQAITTSGEQIPISFKLPFDSSKINPNHTYSIRATIKMDDQLAFTSTTNYPVITQGHPTEVALIVQKVFALSWEQKLIGTQWLLEDLAGEGVLDRLQTTLQFDDGGRISGFAGCNSYFGSYQINGNSFRVTQIGSTFKMCPSAVMNQETRFLIIIEKAQQISLENDFLFIESPDFTRPLKLIRLK